MGLRDNLVEADVVSYAVKRLFADALEQMPPEVFAEEYDARTEDWHRKSEVSRTEVRLDNYLRMRELRINPVMEHTGLRLTWDLDSRQSLDTSVETQCHRASRCSHLRDGLLTAEEGAFLSGWVFLVEGLTDMLLQPAQTRWLVWPYRTGTRTRMSNESAKM